MSNNNENTTNKKIYKKNKTINKHFPTNIINTLLEQIIYDSKMFDDYINNIKFKN